MPSYVVCSKVFIQVSMDVGLECLWCELSFAY